MAIVGDAFAKPMLRALEADPETLGHHVAVRRRVIGRDVERAESKQALLATTPA